tara:strand:- start:1111 stop:1287 length:177 start_codon:yes stop_codon:yes gene_type:complete
MVKKDNGYMQKARSKHSSTRRSKYDILLDQMSADYALSGPQHYTWDEKKGRWWRKTRR